MPIYLEIAVNVPQVSGVFHYHLPPELEGQVGAGHLVEVPFGKQRAQGVVLRTIAEPAVAETRPVLALLDPGPVLTRAQIALAHEMAESTLSPLAAWIDLMLPPGLGQQADTLYQLTVTGEQLSVSSEQSRPVRKGGTGAGGQKAAALSETQRRLVGLLQKRGPLRGRQIDQAMPHVDWRAASRPLVRQGLVTCRSVLPPPTVQPKTVRTAQLACPPEAAEAALTDLGRAGSAALARRQAMVHFLMREAGPVDVTWAYAESGGSLSDLYVLAERGLVTLGESEVWRDPLAQIEFVPAEPPPLTRDQQTAWEAIQAGLHAATSGQPSPPFLLHGVTGSGKTEIYLRMVDEVIKISRQAIILVPEIALTPQTVRRFVARFPGRVGLVHSRLSAGERYDTWRRARLGQLAVVVGPRSALFTPFPNLGLVVLDEFHDDSYYQSEPPFYHAREVAVTYARLAGAACVLGSATPDIASYYRAMQGQWGYLSLPSRILAHEQAVRSQIERLRAESHYHPLEGQAETTDLPPVTVVDMRQELKAGNSSIFSRTLQATLGQVLDRGQQAILFLNRRGTATYVFCRDCGHVLKCPHCDLPLTFHTQRSSVPTIHPLDLPAFQPATFELVCHHCGYQRKMPKTCPQCGGGRIRQYGTGTERVEAEVQALYPQARTLRWDYETTRLKGAHDIILSHFSNQRADVLIGTQMLAKGLDLPLVTLVGAVLADVGLNMPDYRAAERTFSVLTQVAGRAGRSPLGGQVILQTFQPEHYAIQSAAHHDYQAFYQQELAHRRKLGYPPFGRVVRLEYRHADPVQAEAAALSLAAQIQGWISTEGRRATEIVGPVPCFFARLGGLYRWQIVLRGPDPASLLRSRLSGNDRPLHDWRVEVDPVSLL